jgi:hypothetical protein
MSARKPFDRHRLRFAARGLQAFSLAVFVVQKKSLPIVHA